MSRLNDFIKESKEKDLQFFFGDIHHTSNKYFNFKHYKNDDEIIIVTNNIHEIKDNLVLIVDNNKVVYLKDWQVRPIMNYDNGIYEFAVKLNRRFFKTYEFKTNFDFVCFEKEDTFDNLVEVAKEQDKENLPVAQGWGNAKIEWKMNRR